ncbi:hypothetical protein [Ktedonobacter racemifer]|nr:hypothetical protein [Ktedonobacter racemifer]
MEFGYVSLKEVAAWRGKKVWELLVLAVQDAPFYAGSRRIEGRRSGLLACGKRWEGQCAC